jgi:hypothetical protein
MIIKQKDLHQPVFARLLEYLAPLEGETNCFVLSDLRGKEDIEENFSFGEGESVTLVGAGGIARSKLRSFARIMAATPEYIDTELYWSVTIEIPDEVIVGIASTTNVYDQHIWVTSTRILLEIYRILKGLDD